MAAKGKKQVTTKEESAPKSENKVLMTSDQQRLSALIDAAGEPPLIEDVEELSVQLHMIIPKMIKHCYPERSYRWIATDSLEDNLVPYGGIWQLVNRHNHSDPRIDQGLFGIEGGIVYRNQNVLCFTNRNVTIALQTKVEKEFAMRVDQNVENLEKQVGQISRGGKNMPAAVVERVDDPGEGYGGQDILDNPEVMSPDNPDGYYDYEAPAE